MSNQLPIPYNPTIQTMIDGWLAEKLTSKSGSPKTEQAYRTTMQSFRLALQSEGLDVNASPVEIIRVPQSWAARRSEKANDLVPSLHQPTTSA